MVNDTPHSLVEEKVFVGQCLYSYVVDFKKDFDTIPHDKDFENASSD